MAIYRKASQEDLMKFFNGYDKVKRVQLPTYLEIQLLLFLEKLFPVFPFLQKQIHASDQDLDDNGKLQLTEFIIDGIFEEENDKELVENILIQIASLDESIYEVQSRIEGLKLDTRNILAELEKI
jgi:hypothetical protein